MAMMPANGMGDARMFKAKGQAEHQGTAIDGPALTREAVSSCGGALADAFLKAQTAPAAGTVAAGAAAVGATAAAAEAAKAKPEPKKVKKKKRKRRRRSRRRKRRSRRRRR